MARDIAIAGRLLHIGGLLAPLFGLSIWVAAISYVLFSTLWQSGKTESFFAVVGREIRNLEVFNAQSRAIAQPTRANLFLLGGVTQTLTEWICKPLVSMPVGGARRISGVCWNSAFEIVKPADISPECIASL